MKHLSTKLIKYLHAVSETSSTSFHDLLKNCNDENISAILKTNNKAIIIEVSIDLNTFILHYTNYRKTL